MFTWLVAEEMAQWVKALLCKYEDLNSDPQEPSLAGFGGMCLSSQCTYDEKGSRIRHGSSQKLISDGCILQQATKRLSFK